MVLENQCQNLHAYCWHISKVQGCLQWHLSLIGWTSSCPFVPPFHCVKRNHQLELVFIWQGKGYGRVLEKFRNSEKPMIRIVYKFAITKGFNWNMELLRVIQQIALKTASFDYRVIYHSLALACTSANRGSDASSLCSLRLPLTSGDH